MEPDADFRIAVGLLAMVVAIAAGIVAIRVNAAGGLDAALEDDRGFSVFRDWWKGDGLYGYGDEECLEYAKSLANGPNPYEDELSTRGENFSETVDRHERGWTLNIGTYRDERAAIRALEGWRMLDEGGKACLDGEVTVIGFPGSVQDGYGTGQIDDWDGEREQTFTATWRRGDKVIGMDFWELLTGRHLRLGAVRVREDASAG